MNEKHENKVNNFIFEFLEAQEKSQTMATVNQNSVLVAARNACKPKTSAKYTLCDAVVTVLSLVFYVVDIATGRNSWLLAFFLVTGGFNSITFFISDIILAAKYINAGYFEWGTLTLVLCILPSILTQCISLRWHQVDHTAISLPMALSHVSLLGIVHRLLYCTQCLSYETNFISGFTGITVY